MGVKIDAVGLHSSAASLSQGLLINLPLVLLPLLLELNPLLMGSLCCHGNCHPAGQALHLCLVWRAGSGGAEPSWGGGTVPAGSVPGGQWALQQQGLGEEWHQPSPHVPCCMSEVYQS